MVACKLLSDTFSRLSVRQFRTVKCCSGRLTGTGSGIGILGAPEDAVQERRTRRSTVGDLAELGGLGMGRVCCSITMAGKTQLGDFGWN